MGAERLGGGENGCVPVRDGESLGLLDGDSHQLMVDGLTRKRRPLLDPLQDIRG